MARYTLRVSPITRVKELIDLLNAADTVDFDYDSAEEDNTASAVAALGDYCANFTKAEAVSDRIARAKEAAGLVLQCGRLGLPLSGGTFARTCYDVDQSEPIGVIFDQWTELCLVLRTGSGGEPTTIADVSRLLEGTVTSNDPNLIDTNETGEATEMPLFNVMVTAMDNAWEQGVFEWDKSRILEHTDKALQTRLAALDNDSLSEMASLPTLFMYEQNTEGDARVGTIKRIQDRSGKELRIIFEFDDTVPPIKLEKLVDLKWELKLSDFEFSRTHWAIKSGDLYQILREAGIVTQSKAPEPDEPVLRAKAVEVTPTKVFLVHGRDDGKKSSVARFLETRAGLGVIILSERPNKGRSILTKFEQEAGGATYAIVLMTADDLGHLRPEFDTPGAAPNPKHRARQNVIFEMGFFIGKLGVDRVCALVPSGLEKPTDYDGVVYISLDEDEGWQRKLVTELHAADVPVSQSWWQA